MKKSSLLLAIFLIVIPIALSASATVTLESPATATATFDVEVSAGQISNLDAASFYVVYDSSEVRLIGVQLGGLFDPSASLLWNRDIDKVIINNPGVVGVSGSGGLATLKFGAVKLGPTEISLSNILLVENTADTFTVTNGGPITVEVSTTTGSPAPDDGGTDTDDDDSAPEIEGSGNPLLGTDDVPGASANTGSQKDDNRTETDDGYSGKRTRDKKDESPSTPPPSDSSVSGTDSSSTGSGAGAGAGGSQSTSRTAQQRQQEDGEPSNFWIYVSIGSTLVLIAIGGVFFWFYNKKQTPPPTQYPPTQPPPPQPGAPPFAQQPTQNINTPTDTQ